MIQIKRVDEMDSSKSRQIKIGDFFDISSISREDIVSISTDLRVFFQVKLFDSNIDYATGDHINESVEKALTINEIRNELRKLKFKKWQISPDMAQNGNKIAILYADIAMNTDIISQKMESFGWGCADISDAMEIHGVMCRVMTFDQYKDQQIYFVPLLEVKDVANMLCRHDKDGYIIVSACIDVSRRHRGEIGEYAKEIGMTLNGLYMDDKVAKTDYYKRLCLTLDRLESEGYDITKINVLRKKMVGLLNRNNSENREATKELRDRLKKDGYTQTPTAGIYEENGVNVLEHSFVIYTDKIDMEHRGKVYSKAHKYKCDFNELVEYGKQLCAKSAFDQECFSVKYPNYGDAVWMDSEGNVIAKRTMDLGFFTPSRPQRFSFVESLCKYQFPCGGAYRHIVSVDGIVEW